MPRLHKTHRAARPETLSDRIVSFVHAHPGTTPREIASGLGVTRHAVSRAARRAIRRGFFVLHGHGVSVRYGPVGFKFSPWDGGPSAERVVAYVIENPDATSRQIVKALRMNRWTVLKSLMIACKDGRLWKQLDVRYRATVRAVDAQPKPSRRR
jgi:hypothetical protein